MTTTPTQEREAFEAWVSDGVGRPDFSRHRYGYRDSVIDAMWDSWQARAAQSIPKPADEPTIEGYPLWSGIPPAPQVSEWIDSVMDQAQCFASAWAILESLGIENKAMDDLRAALLAAAKREQS